MSSDSSDDENVNKLREAADTQFINDAMFKEKDKCQPEVKEVLPPSLRRSKNEDEQFNLFRVTPEFRKHVAKQLVQILDEQLKRKFDKTTVDNTERKAKKVTRTGVRLFKNSAEFVEIHQDTIRNKQVRPSILKSQLVSEDDNLENCKSVAVNPEEILKKTEVEHWSKRSKAPIYHYRKIKKKLVLQEPPFK